MASDYGNDAGEKMIEDFARFGPRMQEVREMTTARIMAAALASIAAFLLGNSYAACLLSLPGSPTVNLTEAAKRLPSFLLGHGPLSLEAAALATGLVAACAVWCAWAWSLTHGNPERQGEEHGSARWGTVREGRRFMNLEDPDRNIVLTKHFGMAMDRPDHDRRFERNRNVLVVGGSGSGKTRGFFEPNIMQLNSNYLVTDPKGETLPRMGHMWRGDGRGSVPGWARRPRQQALLVRGRPPLRERRCP